MPSLIVICALDRITRIISYHLENVMMRHASGGHPVHRSKSGGGLGQLSYMLLQSDRACSRFKLGLILKQYGDRTWDKIFARPSAYLSRSLLALRLFFTLTSGQCSDLGLSVHIHADQFLLVVPVIASSPLPCI